MKTIYLEHKDKVSLIALFSKELLRIQKEATTVSSTHFYDEISESYRAVIFYYE